MIIHQRYEEEQDPQRLFADSLIWLRDNVSEAEPYAVTDGWASYVSNKFMQHAHPFHVTEFPCYIMGRRGPGWLLMYARIASMDSSRGINKKNYIITEIDDDLLALQFKLVHA